MSRFHDEFFKQKGTNHDKLLVKCLLEENIKKIVGDVHFEEIQYPTKTHVLIYHPWENKNEPKKAVWEREVRQDSNALKQILTSGLEVELIHAKSIKTDYETEVICKSGSFIMGYADVVISMIQSDSLYAECNGFEFHEKHERICKTLVEIKPTIEDAGAVIRQLKTYYDILRNERYTLSMVIVSGESIPDDIEALLNHEKIRVIKI
jgi:hypothetical protein